MIPALRQCREIVRSLYHEYSFRDRIAIYDSMNASLRQRREIVRSLYHKSTSEM